MPQNLIPARRGRFQTRLSRMVNIETPRVIQIPVPGEPGKTVPRTIWIGTLFKSDGKTIDGRHEWEESGAFRNQRGVANPNDLAIFVGELPPLAGEPAPATEAELEPEMETVSTNIDSASAAIAPKAAIEPDPRVKPHLVTLIVECYDYLVTAAAERGLDVLNRPPMMAGPWLEAVNSTLVALLDTKARLAPTPKEEKLEKPARENARRKQPDKEEKEPEIEKGDKPPEAA